VPAKEKPKAQFNIRVDADVVDRYREYCAKHGLDATQQIANFMRRVVDADIDFQEKLWEALRAEI